MDSPHKGSAMWKGFPCPTGRLQNFPPNTIMVLGGKFCRFPVGDLQVFVLGLIMEKRHLDTKQDVQI